MSGLSDPAVQPTDGIVIVIASLSEWNAMDETMRLLTSPANAARLRRSIEQMEAGKGKERELAKPGGSSSRTKAGRTTSTGSATIPRRWSASTS